MENQQVSNTKKLFVGNLAYTVTDWQQLKSDLSQIGRVLRVNIVMDKETGKSKGFAFIVVPDKEVPKFLDHSGADYEGRPLVIKPAIEKEERTDDQGPRPQPDGNRPPLQQRYGFQKDTRQDRRDLRRPMENRTNTR